MNDEFWEDMRDEGFLVVDAPARKIAIYANTSGQIAMVTLMDGQTQALTIEPEEVADVVSRLIKSGREADATGKRIASEAFTYLAIEKARSL